MPNTNTQTTNYSLPVPELTNAITYDIPRIKTAITTIDSTLFGKQDTLVSATTIKTINGNSLLGSGDITISGGGGTGLTPTTIKTANYTAAAADLVRCNSTAGVFSITLPASPADGAIVAILDIGNTFGTNNVTVIPNTGKTIESDTSLILDITGTYVSFVYNSSATNWRLLETPSVPLASNTALVNSGSATNITGILSGNGSTLTGVTLKTINGNELTGSGDLIVTGGTSFSAPTYSYTGTELLKPMFISKPVQSISYNGVLSDITGSTESIFGVYPSTEIDETVYTYNGINVEGFAFNHASRTQIVNFPNLKNSSSNISIGTVFGDILTVNFPELIYSGAIIITFSPENMLITPPVQNTLNLAKLKVTLGINISNYAGTTYTLPPLLEVIGTSGFLMSNCNNLTSFTIPNIPNSGTWAFSNLHNISTLDTSQAVNCGGINISQCSLLTTLNFNNLRTVGTNGVSVTYSPNITSLSFPLLKNSGGAISFALLQRCTSVTFPELVYSSGVISFSNMTALSTLSFPKLVKAGDIQVGSNMPITSFSAPLLQVLFSSFNSNFQFLSTLSLPSLKIIYGSVTITGTATMSVNLSALEKVYNTFTLTTFSTVNLDALKEVSDTFSITPGAASTTISLPNIVSIATRRYQDNTNAINISGTGVTSFTFGNTLKRVGSETAGNVNIANHALSQASVDNILVRLAALDGTNGTYVFKNRTISLNGGTSATPSSTGLTAKATLVARGCTVSHN